MTIALTLTIEDGYGPEFTANRLKSWLYLYVNIIMRDGNRHHVEVLAIEEDDTIDGYVLRVQTLDSSLNCYGDEFTINVEHIKEIIA